MSGSKNPHTEKAKLIADNVARELIFQLETKRREFRASHEMKDYERVSEVSEMITGIQDARRFIEEMGLEGATSRRRAFAGIISELREHWILTARGRGLHYRKSAEMLVDALNDRLADIMENEGLRLISDE